MSDVNEAWRKAQRARWLRPNGHLYVRADAWRLAPPGTPEAKPPGWLDPSATRVRWREAQEAEARAREVAAQEKFERELLDLRRDWEELKREIRAQQLHRKWDGQPRDDRERYTFGKKPKPEPELVSRDAAMRPRGPRPPATPAQQARLAIANARAEEAVARVRQLDPSWPAPQSLTSGDNRDDAETMIRAKEAEIESDAEYRGVWYKRQDGSIFGLRLSAESGLTLDVIQSNQPQLLPKGFRIHQR